MKIMSLTATLGAALLLAGAPVLASAADTQSGPIRLDKVEIAQSYGPRTEFSSGLVSVAFTNENDSPATKIVFALESNGKIIDQIEDNGSYQKGETFRHNFPDFQEDSNQQLTVQQVTFADGSVWNNDNVSYPAPSIDPMAALMTSNPGALETSN